MPYIDPKKRLAIYEEWSRYGGGGLDPPEDAGCILAGQNIRTPGDLNFAITSLIQFYLREVTGHNYAAYNTVIGALECVKLELYRRQVSLYEDQKIKENGDVYS